MNIFKNRPLAFLCAVYITTFFISFYISSRVKAVIIAVDIIVGAFLIVKRKYLSAVCICMMLALLYGYLYFDVYVDNVKALAGSETNVSFEVVSISFINDDIAYLDGKLITEDGNNNTVCHFTASRPGDIKTGDILNADVKFTDIVCVDGFDAEQYYHSKNIWIEGKIESPVVTDHSKHPIRNMIEAIREYCSRSFSKYTDEGTAALLNALSIGDKSGIDDSVRRDFRRLGLSHMLAISGMHLAVIMGCITAFTDILRLNKRICSVIVSLLCFSYIFISGVAASVVRAGIMFILMSLATLVRRKGDSLTNLFVTVFLIITVSPSGIFDVGLILSFTSSLGIIVIVGSFMRSERSENGPMLLRKAGMVLITPILTTLSAMGLSFIPLIGFFDEVSLVSVISNICLIPFITVLLFILPCFLLVSFFPLLPALIGVYLDLVVYIIYRIVEVLSAIPNASINLNYPFFPYTFIGFGIGAVAVFVIRKRNAYIMPYLCWFLALCVCVISYNFSFGNASDVVFYSESGSDSILIRNGASSVYLDLGRGSNAAQKRAFNCIDDELYTKEINAWIITCYSNDAVHNVSDYLNEYYVRNIFIPYPENAYYELCAEEIKYYADKENVDIYYYRYGEEFTCNKNLYTVYSPITFDDSSVMIPSVDVRCNGETVSYYGCGYFDHGEARGDCDYLYLGEKGSKRKQKNSPAINAEYAVIAENNETAVQNVTAGEELLLTDEDKLLKIRIG